MSGVTLAQNTLPNLPGWRLLSREPTARCTLHLLLFLLRRCQVQPAPVSGVLHSFAAHSFPILSFLTALGFSSLISSAEEKSILIYPPYRAALRDLEFILLCLSHARAPSVGHPWLPPPCSRVASIGESSTLGHRHCGGWAQQACYVIDTSSSTPPYISPTVLKQVRYVRCRIWFRSLNLCLNHEV